MILGQYSTHSPVTTICCASSRHACDQQACFNTWNHISVEEGGA